MMKDLLLLFLFVQSVRITVSRHPELNVPQGKLKGVFLESSLRKRQYAAFFSVPYAEPPLGAYRFKEPVPSTKSWENSVRDATKPPHPCKQLDLFSLPELKVVGSEDCLYLNIFTPKIAKSKDSELMSVIVHIHGGAFLSLSGHEYGPERLMDRDVVYVSFNYRLGPLGFLSTQDLELPGNNGLKDQTEALKWIKRNIIHFGGDPERITITGDSAGAASVMFHMISPLSKHLFNRVIAESGTSLAPWALNENPKQDAIELASNLGCPTQNTSTMVRCLRKLPADNILLQTNHEPLTGESDFFPYTPVIEPQNPTAFLTKPVTQLIKEGQSQDVPLLMTFTEAEGLLEASGYLANETKAKHLETNWTGILPDILDFRRVTPKNRIREVSNAIRQHYLHKKSINESVSSFVKMFSDRSYFYWAEKLSKLYAKSNRAPVYVYQFSYKGKKRSIDPFPTEIYNGATHVENTLYVLRAPRLLEIDPSDTPMATSLVDLWMNFTSGEPMMEKWKPVKEGLPRFNFLDVTTADWESNQMKSYVDFSNAEFWSSLKLKDNVNLRKH